MTIDLTKRGRALWLSWRRTPKKSQREHVKGNYEPRKPGRNEGRATVFYRPRKSPHGAAIPGVREHMALIRAHRNVHTTK